jgi:hypothetical protein
MVTEPVCCGTGVHVTEFPSVTLHAFIGLIAVQDHRNLELDFCGMPFILLLLKPLIRETPVGIATGCRQGSIPGRENILIFSIASKSALRHTQLSIQWVPGPIYLGVNGPEREVWHSFHLVSRLRLVELHFHSTISLHGILLN